MNHEKLNILVASYQKSGDEELLNEIFREVNPIIERTSRSLENVVEDFTKFDCRVVLKIRQFLKSFDEEKHDFMAVVKSLIYREKQDFEKRRHRKLSQVSKESIELVDNGDDSLVGIQFASSVNVEDEILLQEKIALLAQGDSRKSLILSQWSKGANDVSISEVLAHRFGGNPTGHRSFIKRFKTDCYHRLSTDA